MDVGIFFMPPPSVGGIVGGGTYFGGVPIELRIRVLEPNGRTGFTTTATQMALWDIDFDIAMWIRELPPRYIRAGERPPGAASGTSAGGRCCS